MNRVMKNITAGAICLFAATALALPPKQLITHNTTDYESNGFIDGTIASQYPTKPHSDGKVAWTAVKLACFGHAVDGKCSALIKIATNTANPIEIGTLSLDLNTGDITPKYLSANGFSIAVTGLGETTISTN